MQKTTTFFMFVGKKNGKAEEAITFYTALFKNSQILDIVRYGSNEGETEGAIKHAKFTINGQEYMAMDSGREHPFTFTPAVSIFVTCETEDEIDKLYKALSQDGELLMLLDNYGFSKKFGWVNDKYSVSWQLNLADDEQKSE